MVFQRDQLSQKNGTSYAYSYDANRLSSITNGKTSVYLYDNAANTINDGTKDFVYNQNNRLIKAVENGKTLGEYTYNGNGQRVIKRTGPAATNSASSQNTVYHYDLSGKIIEETDGNGKLIVDYVYLANKPLAMIRKQENNEETFYYHNDHLGTPKVMTDKLKKVVWNIELDPFGNEAATKRRQGSYIRSVENNLRFPGQYYDSETGMHYNYYRDYNPKNGRYLETDPQGLRGGPNLYSYVSNRPTSLIDPFGLYSWGDVTAAWDHYCDGTETPWSTSFSSINWGDARTRINTAIRNMIGSSCRDTTIPVNIDVEAQTEGADAVIIGRHTIHVSGQIKLNCDCSWTFTGSMASARGYDPYNFNPSNRGLVGEVSTWIGRNRCPNTGRTFNINITGSESLSFSGRLN